MVYVDGLSPKKKSFQIITVNALLKYIIQNQKLNIVCINTENKNRLHSENLAKNLFSIWSLRTQDEKRQVYNFYFGIKLGLWH
jgi:Txe/YoeB family toxin of Txe-Axe toxin-antitoxin module